ncbi:hypothetical protein GY14_07185 [Delftia tsuruhatensis]|nr:hypothetical protein GY14_07185 [Delftia tsuruhatensis]
MRGWRVAGYPAVHALQGPGIGQIGLVDDDQVGPGHLALQRVGQQRIGGLREQGAGIQHHDDSIERQTRIGQAQLGDAPGVGDAAGLDHHGVEALALLQHADQGHGQVIADLAAHAAIGQRDGVAAVVLDQACIDVERAEVVDQHGQPLAIRMAQPVVEQRGLAGAQEAADDRERQPLPHVMPP